MQGNISENRFRKILGAELAPSPIIDDRINQTYEMIRAGKVIQKHKGSTAMRKIAIGIGSVAAVFAMMVTFSVMNPVLASEIPILGGVFAKLSDVFSFGQIPAEDTVILYHENENAFSDGNALNESAVNQDSAKEPAYQKTSGDITITLTEEYATNQAVYIGVHVENAQEFPKITRCEDGTQYLSAETEEQYSFRPDSVQSWRNIEGKFADAHTFDGILRIDYSEIDDGKYEIPETFTMELGITNIVGDLDEPLPVEGKKTGGELERMTDEEWAAYMKSLPQEYYEYPNKYQNWWQEGNWSYDLTITQKDNASRVIEINRTNDAGIGIRSIELSAVEMTLNVIGGADTVAVALDADGNKIENGGTNAYELAIADHDISKVYIYICDYDEYMNEIKGYGIPGNHLGKAFQEVLEERAVFKTVVDIGE